MPTTYRSAVSLKSVRKILGVYPFSMSALTVPAAAHNGTTTGFLWWAMPAAAGAGRHARLRRLSLTFGNTSTTATLTSPRVLLGRFTFTGLPSGTQVNPSVRLTGDTAPQAQLFSTSATWAVTLVDVFAVAGAWTALVPAELTGVGVGPTCVTEFRPDFEDDFLDISLSEGFVLYLADAGSGATRILGVSGAWDEYISTDTTETSIILPDDSGNVGKLTLVVSST
jgi:hypothetical protein